jgi:hypothetical protein
MPLGQIILNAKSTTIDRDVRRTWILFGDPAMRIQTAAPAKQPQKQKLSFSGMPQAARKAGQPNEQ